MRDLILCPKKNPRLAAPSINQYGRSLSAEEIEAGKHRELVGGLWDELGSLQIEFLKNQGLSPSHVVLDVGCGCLRGGIPLIRYLDAGNYFGVDINRSLLEAGVRELLSQPDDLVSKHPTLVEDGQFEFSVLGRNFDCALAISVFTHLPLNHIGRCLRNIKSVLAPAGVFYATYFEAPCAVHIEELCHRGGARTFYDADPYHYAPEELANVAAKVGLTFHRIGEWGHPRGQMMAAFTHIGCGETRLRPAIKQFHPVALPADSPRSIEVSMPGDNGKTAGRRLVVVLGMHRCGTSLLANFLSALGVDLGRDLMKPDQWNANGYWELQGLAEVGDEILAQLDRSYLSPKGVLPFADGWWRLASIQPLKQRLKDILLSQMGESSPLWGFKDPRTASLLPLWQEVFDELGVAPIYLLAVRHPQAVTSSMVRRNKISSFHAQMLYVMTNLDAVRHTGGQIRAVIDYDRWFTHPEEQARVVLSALEMADRFTPEQITAAITQVVKGDLRHHLADEDDGLLPQALRVYQVLRRASSEGTLPPELWEIEREFRQAQKLFASWVDAGMLPVAPPSTYAQAAKALESAPAMLSSSERHLLYALTLGIRPQRVLEIGTMHGGSAQIIVAALDAAGVGRLVCLDPRPDLKIDWNTIAHRATLLEEGSPEAIARAQDAAGGPFDLCFIDGWHVYGQVLVDACTVLEYMAPDGYILFHDAYQPRVREAIDDFVRNNPVVDCGIVSRQYNTAAPNGPWAGLRLVRVAKTSNDAPLAPLPWTSRVSAEQEHKLLYAEKMIQERQLAEARKALNSILLTEQPAEVLNDYAVIEILQGRAATARLLLQKALEIVPAYQPAVDNLQYLAQRMRASVVEG